MVAIPRRLASPAQIVAHLDAHVVGQARAKRVLALAAYSHYLPKRARAHGLAPQDLGSQNTLLLGPTGVGKSLLVRTLANFLEVPVAFVAATSLVETGYVGTPVDGMYQVLVDRAGGDVLLAEQGILLIDEIDKLKRAPEAGRDVSGEGVQNGLLTLFDGRPVRVRTKDGERWLDASRVLILCTGAFADLPRRVRQRLHRETSGLGFRDGGAASRQPLDDGQLYALATPEDIVSYGLIPELVGRFPLAAALAPLDAAELERVLCDVPGAPLPRVERYFELHGVRLEVTPCARRAIVQRAQAHGLGARSLQRIVNETFAELQFRVTDAGGRAIASIHVDGAVVHGVRPAQLATHTTPLEQLGPTLAAKLQAPALAPAPESPPPGTRERRRQPRPDARPGPNPDLNRDRRQDPGEGDLPLFGASD